MSRLADGRFRCPRCEGVFAAHEMPSNQKYCWPCKRAKGRELHAARRNGQAPRPKRYRPPEGLAEQVAGRTDEDLAAMYDVCERTIREWRKALGIGPGRKVHKPADFDELAKDMTMPEVVARWGVHENTAYRWLREMRGEKPPHGYAMPVPADWAQVCRTRHALATAEHYGVSRNTVARWARVSGIRPMVGKPGGPQRLMPVLSVRPAKPRPAKVSSLPPMRPEQPSARVPAAPVYVHTNGCLDCTRDRLCRAHQTAQLNADIEAWMAAGNRPREVPQGATGLQFGWTRPAQ